MSYLDRLRNLLQIASKGDVPKVPKVVLSVLSPTPRPVVLQKEVVDPATTSRWWLIHYPDREPLQVACFPDAAHPMMLERHPEAIAAEPLDQVAPEPATACTTCAHTTQRGACGEPVAAGLSKVPGVIFYGKNGGAMCQAWFAIVPPEQPG